VDKLYASETEFSAVPVIVQCLFGREGVGEQVLGNPQISSSVVQLKLHKCRANSRVDPSPPSTRAKIQLHN